MTAIDDDLFKRIVLMNQYTILSHLDTDDSARWQRAADKVRDHYPIDELPGVDWMLESRSDPFTEDDRKFVRDVFQVYEALQLAEDKGIVTPSQPAMFAGFDGNGETKYMAYARATVEHDEKWTYVRISSKDFNAHHPTLDVYQRMLDEWEARGKSLTLDAEGYDAIVAARVHPSNRP